jgi:carbon-monoxide dehydrogenase medium subunit
MILPRFEYRAARSVDEATTLWSEVDGARYFAGGTDLLPQVRLGALKVPRVVDVKRIAALGAIRETDAGALSIGAAVSLAAVASHPLVRARYQALVMCCEAVGAYPLRNRATLVGNLCNASPAADTAVALLCLEAQVVAQRPGGTRTLPLAGFFLGPRRSALEPGELVTEVLLPASTAGMKASYQRLSRRQGMDLATVAVLVAHAPAAGHRVALVAVAPTPLRVPTAEALLDREGPAAARRAGEVARAAASPITDVRGSAEYRREMVGVLVARGVSSVAAG